MPHINETDTVPIIIRCPPSIGMRLLEESIKRGVTVQAVILELIAKRFKISHVSRGRGRPRKVV
jgi:hypothetical protein